MHKQNFQDIIAQVQTPTRYTGNEINTVKKELSKVDLTFALAFPDLYEIGTSHFGLQILYHILNRHKDVAAERFFAPAPDLEALMRERKIPCLSLESGTPLNRFDIIGISLLYELNFTNILTLLELSGIPFFAEQRDDTFPLIIGGGPCAFNPEPLALFFDAFVIGDGEEAAVEVAQTVIAFKQQGDGQKKTLLRMLSRVPGVYVPSLFNTVYNGSGLPQITPEFDDYTRVKRAFLPALTRDLFPESPILPYAKPVHDRLRLEVARGCSRGCRFCQAGMIYRPVRERSITDLVDIAKASLKATGYSDISLLSLSTGDYSHLAQLMTELMQLDPGHCNAISLPSVRAEKLTSELMNIIKKVRKTGFTIAPEAGSQKLRDVINKNLTEESIEATVKNAFELGWKNIKLYFMMGLPFETPDDIQAIADLSKRLASRYAKGKKMINVSTTSFIPKAHTPFQRCAQDSLDVTREKLQYLKDNLRHPKVNLKWQDPRMSLIEGVWARGDRRLSKLLVAAYENGCRLDGWTDRFDPALWDNAFEKTGIDPEFYTTRIRQDDEVLPWDHIDTGVSPRFLSAEYKKARQMALTPDCRENDCTGCGVCDFKTIAPVLNDKISDRQPEVSVTTAPPLDDNAFAKFDITFSKLDNARFFGHLELASIVQRAIRRTGLAVKYSKGFHPSMRLAFANALPVGMESEEEHMFVYLDRTLSAKVVMNLLDAQLPEGLRIKGCTRFAKNPAAAPAADTYVISFSEPVIEVQQVDRFLNQTSFIVEDVNKKGKIRKTDLRQVVKQITFIDRQTMQMKLMPFENRAIRPTQLLRSVFGLDEQQTALARIKKITQG